MEMFGNSSVSDINMLDYWSDFLAKELRPVLIIISVYLFLGTVGNTFVMYIYWSGKKPSGEDRFFIPFLALFDLCASAVCSGSEIITEVNPLRFDSDIVCKMMAFSSIAFVTMSSHLLLLITIDRYLKICAPFKSQMTLRWKRLSLVLIVFAGVVISLPSVVVYGSVAVTKWTGNVTGKLCINVPSGEGRMWHLAYKTIMFIYGSVHFLALVVLYILIIRSIYVRSRARLRLQSNQWLCPAREEHGRKQATERSKPYKLKSDSSMDMNSHTGSPGQDVLTSTNSIAIISDGITCPGEPEPEVDDFPQTSPGQGDEGQRMDESCTVLTKNGLPISAHTSQTQTNQHGVPNTPVIQRQDTKQVKTSKIKIKGLRLTLVFLLISIIYAVTICLKLVLMTMETARENFWTTMTPSEFVVFRFLYSVFVVNFIVNPFVYGFLDRTFQQIVKERCACR
ncbi:Orexin receptor type 2 [Mizuhopecten yessoensis]|uniref:Orexin receptor type 2 n=1 Tax=Mizuhopecten yessoensis TaxID=6573 RepID=A0A210PJY0_MIZYE|nr:Orexin receptor type 2 [Mizuhopecten yessoensis]